MSNGEINTFVQINSLDPINSSHLATKNYVDLRDDDIILQMNSAFEENINFQIRFPFLLYLVLYH